MSDICPISITEKKLVFTPCKVKQPLQGMELKRNKENQEENHTKR